LHGLFKSHAQFLIAAPLVEFCEAASEIILQSGNTERTADLLVGPMKRLVADASWLGGIWGQDDPVSYQQHRLYVDPEDRFSVVSFVWGPGQSTPVHDHGVWGLVGIARGAERIQRFAQENSQLVELGEPLIANAGEVDVIKPSLGDIHRVSNLFEDRTSISIHVYGSNIGKQIRRSFSLSGKVREFVSGYSSVPPALTSPQVSVSAGESTQ